MPRRLVVVRPEPGNARTAALARDHGWHIDAMPLFAVRPLGWAAPDPGNFDALLLTSANAVRHGGDALATLRGLPVLAVGEATAAAARHAGFAVALTGSQDGAVLVAAADRAGYRRLLHLAGRERTALPVAAAVAVYASESLSPADAATRLAGAVVLLHSARAAARVAELAQDRAATAVAAIGAAVLTAAGPGWRAGIAAAVPTDTALLAAAAALPD